MGGEKRQKSYQEEFPAHFFLASPFIGFPKGVLCSCNCNYLQKVGALSTWLAGLARGRAHSGQPGSVSQIDKYKSVWSLRPRGWQRREDLPPLSAQSRPHVLLTLPGSCRGPSPKPLLVIPIPHPTSTHPLPEPVTFDLFWSQLSVLQSTQMVRSSLACPGLSTLLLCLGVSHPAHSTAYQRPVPDSAQFCSPVWVS